MLAKITGKWWIIAALGLAFAAVAAARRWSPPPAAAPYLPQLYAAESANRLPRGMLVRVAYQESRFRPDIIDGRIISSAGAVGIMQIVPWWHPEVDPRDPDASIAYAGEYLRQLFNRFGSWEKALAAYNWGPGNVAKYGRDAWPQETRDYVRDVMRDVAFFKI